MASSSVSQEDRDVENDFEKLEKRSRIRTARARQINPQGCRLEAERVLQQAGSCISPLSLDIEENLTELHLEPVTISPYSLPGEAGGADTSPKGRDGAERERGNRKDSVRAGERQHAGKPHHGIKGKQQRDRRKLREKRRSTGVVHLASTESTGGSTSAEEELSETDMGTETKRNTQQNESIGEQGAGQGVPLLEEVTTTDQAERKNSGPSRTGPAGQPGHSRTRLRNKVARSEDMEADDELGDKTDNDHERISPAAPAAAAAPPPPPAQPDPNPESDMAKQLDEKDRRIQLLELKIQQLTKESAAIIVEHDKLKRENTVLQAALEKTVK